MSLVFAAIAPHSPVLLPSIGREHSARLKKTTDALKRLEGELYAVEPDVLLIISPHGPVESEHFTIDFSDDYVCSLKEFGAFDVGVACRPDMKLMSGLREHLEDSHIPVMIRTEETLDYGVVVPLALLAPKLKRRSVVPVYPSLLPAKVHFDCGKAIQEVIVASDRRVAVIASADLSHRLTRNAPGGYSPSGKKFDEKVIQLVGSKNTSGLVNLDPALAQKAGECGWSSLVMLSGILDRMELRPEILCYEAPFGIGCLTAQYHFA